MNDVKTSELVHGTDKAKTINAVNKVLETYGLTIETIDINDLSTVYSINVLK